MLSQLFVWLQLILPTHWLSRLSGVIADCRVKWIKTKLITTFIQYYQINLTDALIEDPQAYPCFSDFFIRQLKPDSRPIAPSTFISPVDGVIVQKNNIEDTTLIQAKGLYFNLKNLLGEDEEATGWFRQGQFATLYLAPFDYHRFHMPITGQLIRTIYLPGRLFSVNKTTTALLPNLYGRNERLVCLFDTTQGKVAMILIGALIVGGIQTVWMNSPIRATNVIHSVPEKPIQLAQADELGFFKMGSSVIILKEKQAEAWSGLLKTQQHIRLGEALCPVNEIN